MAAIEQEEARQQTVLREIEQLDETRLTKEIQGRLGDVPTLFGRHVPMARQMLGKLLDGHIYCEPIMEEGKPGYRFTATGTFDRVLIGAGLINNGGGGEGS